MRKAASKLPSHDTTHLPAPTFVLDNGAYHLKAGFAPSRPCTDFEALESCTSLPNALARTGDKRVHVAAQIDGNVTNWSDATFRRPVERGQLVSWEAQKAIWDQSFFEQSHAKPELHVKQPEETTLLLTEAPNTMPSLQRNADEIIMEEWGFGGYVRMVGRCVATPKD